MKNTVGLVAIFLSIFLSCTHVAFGQTSIVGQWKTIDDDSGKPKSIVEIYKKGDQYFGKVVKLFREPGEEQDPICEECDEDDSRYNHKVIGMEILKNTRFEDDEYVDGEILDPENGKIYSCKLWIEEDKLKLRGYIGFFYRTQTWHKAN